MIFSNFMSATIDYKAARVTCAAASPNFSFNNFLTETLRSVAKVDH
jgi:hypothetical protein